MQSTVTVWMVNGVYRVTLPTGHAHELVQSLRQSWRQTHELNELHLADGTTVTPNPRYITAIEVS